MRFDLEKEMQDLWRSVVTMGGEADTRSLISNESSEPKTELSFDSAICQGLEVSWEDIALHNGLFKFRELPVMFALAGDDHLHLKQCELLQDIDSSAVGTVRSWFRSRVDDSSKFQPSREVIESHNICLHCLYELNYMGFFYGDRERREMIRDAFAFDRFVADHGASYFSHASSVVVFDHPEQLIKWFSPLQDKNTEQRREEIACSECEVQSQPWQQNSMLQITRLLTPSQVANASETMSDFCWECYKKQNFDLGLCIPYEIIESINLQRRKQGLLEERGWGLLKQYSDSAYYGLLDHLQRNIGAPPELFYPVQLSSGKTALLLYAWPETRKAITPLAHQLQDQLDWSLWDTAETLANFASR